MIRRFADRCILVLALDVAALVVFVSLAASPLGSIIAPACFAAALLGCWFASALVGATPRGAERLDVCARVLGMASLVASVVLVACDRASAQAAALLCTGIALVSGMAYWRRGERHAGSRANPIDGGI